MNIDKFQSYVSRKDHKMKQIHIILLCLNYVDENPGFASKIGAFWNTDSSFMINSTIFGKFIGRKPNTINRNFRTHSFTMKKTTSEMRKSVSLPFSFENLPDPRNWFERKCDGFSKSTTESEAINWKYCELIPKKKKKTNFTDEAKISKYIFDFSYQRTECENQKIDNTTQCIFSAAECPLFSNENIKTKNSFINEEINEQSLFYLNDQNNEFDISSALNNDFFFSNEQNNCDSFDQTNIFEIPNDDIFNYYDEI